MSERAKKIVICASQRSGSTMVCEDLIAGGMGKPDEWFIPWRLENGKDWAAELDAVKAKGSTENSIFAAKLMANQLGATDRCLATFLPPEASGPYPHLRSLFRDAVWVWVRRRDTVAQAISHHLAKGSKVFHVIGKTSGFVPGNAVTADKAEEKLKDVPYDFKAIMQEWYQIQRDNLVWEQFFEAAAIAPTVVWYEDYSLAFVKEVADLMGVPAPTIDNTRNLVKMPSRRNNEIRRRFLNDLLESA